MGATKEVQWGRNLELQGNKPEAGLFGKRSEMHDANVTWEDNQGRTVINSCYNLT